MLNINIVQTEALRYVIHNILKIILELQSVEDCIATVGFYKIKTF